MYWFKLGGFNVDGFKRKWIACLLAVLAGVVAQPQQVQRDPNLSWVDSTTRTAIDKIFAPYAAQDSPGYVLGLIKDGKLVFAKGYGQANLDDGIALTPQTAFHLVHSPSSSPEQPWHC
jgi:CubicO group peptidase (beta-lactamase class C family)